MNKHHIQFAGLLALFLLAGGLLVLIGYTFASAAAKMTADGKVPIADAGLFTAFLLSFQQVVGGIRSIWESQERSTLAEGLGNSTPATPAPQSAQEAAKQVAGAAVDEAAAIEGEPA
jgi:hypothetical protein